MANLAPCFLRPVSLFFSMSGLSRPSVFCHSLCSMRAMLCWMMRVCGSEDSTRLGLGLSPGSWACDELPPRMKKTIKRRERCAIRFLMMLWWGVMCEYNDDV